jgi:hypothetical protein
MAVTDGVHHYSRTRYPAARAGRRKNDDPEQRLQVAVVTYLTYALPPAYLWTADASGARVGMQTAIKLKNAGVKRGNPDIRILFPSAVTRYIEVKAGTGLSAEQIAFRDFCQATGRDIWALARTVEDVDAALRRWGVTPKCPVEKANRYG